jgi:hypothetical protein
VKAQKLSHRRDAKSYGLSMDKRQMKLRLVGSSTKEKNVVGI